MVAMRQANVVQNFSDADIFILSREEFEDYQKMKRNSEYIAKLDRAFNEIDKGNIVYHDIAEGDD